MGTSEVTGLIYDGWIGGRIKRNQIAALILAESVKQVGFPLVMSVEEKAL